MCKVKSLLINGLIILLFGSSTCLARECEGVDFSSSKVVDSLNCLLEKIKKIESKSNGVDQSEVHFAAVEAWNATPTKTESLGKNRFCAISRVSNNNHTNSACSCSISKANDTWNITVENTARPYDIKCDCTAICVR